MRSSEASGHRIVTLTTDFGCRDTFVGQMKGVILTIAPGVTLVDITHDIEPYAIGEAASAIASACRCFPEGTVHVGVVDPGVGSERRALIVESDGHLFVGPDNGIFFPVFSGGADARAFVISDPRFVRGACSPTFQGRDLFAPVAALLAAGAGPEEFGPPCTEIAHLRISVPTKQGDCIVGEVVSVDRFGNAVTNITREHRRGQGEQMRVEVRGVAARLETHYAAAKDKELHCLFNSSGYLELFVREGSAVRSFGVGKGDRVVLCPGTARS